MTTLARKFQPLKAPVKKLKTDNEDDDISHDHGTHNVHEKPGRGIIKKHPRGHGNDNKDIKNLDMQEEAFDFENVINKQTVAMDILKNGYIQSYIDFFYITSHTLPGIIIPSAKYIEEMENKKREKPKYGDNEEELKDLKKRLIDAEENNRYSDKTAPIEEYSRLAEDFASKYQDYQAAAYFYKKCISIAKSANDAKWECLSYRGIGKCFSFLDRSDQAIDFLELAIKKAEENQLINIVMEISQDLVKIYGEMAAMYEKLTDEESMKHALYYLEKCLEASVLAKNHDYEGKICHKIGIIYLNQKNFEKSLEYQLRDLELAKKTLEDKDRIREIEAHAALAKTYLNLNKMDEALLHLEKYYSIANEKKKSNHQADASLNLAKVYAQKGNPQKSLDFYTKHFECARLEKKDKDRKLVDKARVILGMAKANGNQGNFIKIVQNSNQNIKVLLDWKVKKEK
jgi:tetratricopeptide (TPR) repeat protein